MGLLDVFAKTASREVAERLLRGTGRDRLTAAYDAKAEFMRHKPIHRPSAAPDRERFIGEDYHNPRPRSETALGPDQLYHRNPDPSAPLPNRDRARLLQERGPEIADALAGRIAASGQMDAPTRYFYHSDGPIYRAAIEAGLTPEQATAYVEDFGQTFAATSPQTKVAQNVPNATSVMAKQAQGIPHREIIGPGTVDPKTGKPGISESGYPMMTGKGGLHGSLLDQVVANGHIDPLSNPKPSNFAHNMGGNRDTATIDMHAIRGALQTLNQIDPGAVPEGFILPKFRAAYAADPSTLNADMIDVSLGSQKVDGVDTPTEYPIFADIFHGAADQLGVSPAETQSMAWFGFGDETNLGSTPHTVADVFDERLNITAQYLGLPVKEVAGMVFRREIPLFELGAAAGAGGLLGLGASSDPELEEYLRSIGAR